MSKKVVFQELNADATETARLHLLPREVRVVLKSNPVYSVQIRPSGLGVLFDNLYFRPKNYLLSREPLSSFAFAPIRDKIFTSALLIRFE